ncbi:MAG: GHKL domain-containing protein [Phycisphaerae bacterium]|nr:GHKL domain-containing protein [Phycisphaerae bacterium]
MSAETDKSIQRALEEDKELRLALYQKQRNLEAIFDAVPIGMLLIDRQMIVKRVNNTIRKITAKDYSQLIDKNICDILGCKNTANDTSGNGCLSYQNCVIIKTIQYTLKNQQPLHQQDFKPNFKANDQQVKPWFSLTTEPIIFDNKLFVVLTIEDITVRKRAEEKLLETMALKSQFISTVSHELRTPLACMKESITIVLDQIAGKINKKQRKFLDIAKRNVDRLSRLINNVLDFQKLEAGKMTCHMEQDRIESALEEVYETMLAIAKKKNINLSLEITDNPGESIFDRDKIIQIVTNLVNNAIKFTPDKGTVTIKAGEKKENIFISIKDTGIGIPADDLRKIFNSFYRVYRSGKEIQGTGLGLPIVKKIVDMHHGRIDVESELNKGSTFTVYLPKKFKVNKQTVSAENDQLLEKAIT